MSKQNKEEKLRYEGVTWAFRRIKEAGLEKAKEEFDKRGATRAVLGIEQSEIHRFEQDLRECCKKTMCAMTCLTLHDEFGFGHDRLEKFIARWNMKVECLAEDLADWPDFVEVLKDECNIDIDMPIDYRKKENVDRECSTCTFKDSISGRCTNYESFRFTCSVPDKCVCDKYLQRGANENAND